MENEDEDVHPEGHDSTRWDHPRLGCIVVGRGDAVATGFAQEPRDSVEQQVGDDTSDNTICDASFGV